MATEKISAPLKVASGLACVLRMLFSGGLTHYMATENGGVVSIIGFVAFGYGFVDACVDFKQWIEMLKEN